MHPTKGTLAGRGTVGAASIVAFEDFVFVGGAFVDTLTSQNKMVLLSYGEDLLQLNAFYSYNSDYYISMLETLND